jgi:hypothetical protein
MIRKLKTLGIAVVAVLAMSAVVASAASAANFTASSYPTGASATSAAGNDDFKTEAGSIECHGAFSVASISEPTENVTVTPTYKDCTAFGGFVSASVNMNGCDYVFHVNGVVDIECPAGKAIVITAGACEIDVPEQTGLKSVSLSNVGNHINVKAGVSGITYEVTKDGFGCPFSGTGHKTGATYTQNSAVTVIPTKATSIHIG